MIHAIQAWSPYRTRCSYKSYTTKGLSVSSLVNLNLHEEGVEKRLKTYPKIHGNPRIAAEKGAHGMFLRRKDEQANLRLIVIFSQSMTAKQYVILMELLLSLLLQIFSFEIRETCMRASTIEIIKRATPQHLPAPESEGLNHAAQCHQGLYHSRLENVICANENCGATETFRWYNADSGMPLTRHICYACHVAKYYHSRWPVEFDSKKNIKASQMPLGYAAKMWVNAGDVDRHGKPASSDGWYCK